MRAIRCAVATLLAGVALTLVPASAWAHDGVGAAFNGLAGPYRVYAYDPVAAAHAGTLEYRLVLLNAADGSAVDGAHPTVRATRSDGSRTVGPVDVRSVANIYYYDLPDPGGQQWRVRLSIDGPLGPGATSYSMHGLEEQAAPASDSASDSGSASHSASSSADGSDTGVLVGSGIGVAIALCIAGSIALRRRTPRPASNDA